MNKQLPTQGIRTSEELRKTMLGYGQCRRFDDAVKEGLHKSPERVLGASLIA